MEDKRVLLEIDGVKVECSQKQLAESSDYFRAMFHGSFVENQQSTIHLKDISPADLKLSISLVQQPDNIIDLNLNQALGVLQISSMFQFRDLQPAVELHLSNTLLDVDSCLYIFNAAEALLIPKLQARASVFCLWEFPKVTQTEAFLELQLEEIKRYLSCDKLNTPNGEMDVYNAAVRWLAHNDFSGTLEVLQCVRFHLFTADELSTILKSKVPSECPLIGEVVTAVLDSITPSREEVGQEARHPHQRGSLSAEVLNLTKNLNCIPRRTPLVPCFAGYVSPKKEDSQRKPKMLAFCFDEERKEKLFPFLAINHDAVGCAIIGKGDLIYTVGGELVLGQGKWNNALWAFDLWKRQWEEMTTLPSPRRHHSVIFREDDLYLLCGCGKFRVVLQTFEKYNTKLDEWTTLPSLPQSAYSVAACEHKGSIYVMHNQTLCYQYSIEAKQWTKIPATFPPAAGFTSAISYGDFIYLTGPYSNDVYKFEPELGAEAVLVGEFTHGAQNTCLVGCSIYSFTAIDGEIYVERYDISTNEFSNVWNSKTEPLSYNVDFIHPLRAFSAVNCMEEICLDF